MLTYKILDGNYITLDGTLDLSNAGAYIGTIVLPEDYSVDASRLSGRRPWKLGTYTVIDTRTDLIKEIGWLVLDHQNSRTLNLIAAGESIEDNDVPWHKSLLGLNPESCVIHVNHSRIPIKEKTSYATQTRLRKKDNLGEHPGGLQEVPA